LKNPFNSIPLLLDYSTLLLFCLKYNIIINSHRRLFLNY